MYRGTYRKNIIQTIRGEQRHPIYIYIYIVSVRQPYLGYNIFQTFRKRHPALDVINNRNKRDAVFLYVEFQNDKR